MACRPVGEKIDYLINNSGQYCDDLEKTHKIRFLTYSLHQDKF